MSDFATNPCRVCGKEKSEHTPGKIIHLFVGQNDQAALSVNEGSSSPDATLGKPQGLIGTLPTDPVLRMALIRKGVLQVSDLDEIEAELRVTGVSVHQPGPHNG